MGKMVLLTGPEQEKILLTPEEFQTRIQQTPLEVGWNWHTVNAEGKTDEV